MDRKIKVVAATSLLALTAAACAPNPYYTGTGYNNYGTTTTTTNRGAVNRNAVSHTHCGRTHSHVLPAEGLAHHHGDGCVAGSGGAAPVPTTAPNYNYGYTTPPVATPAPQQPAINYGYTAPAATPYYDYSANSGGGSSSYYDYAAPKTPTAPTNTYRTPPAKTPTTTTSNSGEYVVQKGDTVFQVMRNTGVYWKDIIRLNNLQAPDYPINPGQRLRLK